jgi:hypothetical protein
MENKNYGLLEEFKKRRKLLGIQEKEETQGFTQVNYCKDFGSLFGP